MTMGKRKSNSRPARWAEAVGRAREALDELTNVREDAEAKCQEAWEAFKGQLEAVAAECGPSWSDAAANLEAALSDLNDLKSEYEEWQGNLPENLQSSALGDKLQTICDMNFEHEVPTDLELADLDEPTWESIIEFDLSEVESAIDDAEGADLPLGFGKD